MDSNRIYCLDCVEGLKELTNQVDLIVTSPPYDDLRTYDGHSAWNFGKFTHIAHGMAESLKEGGVIVWVVGDAVVDRSETGSSFRQALYFKDECGLNLHDTMIYQKRGSPYPSGSKSKRYTQIFEYMFVFSKGPPKTVNLIMDKSNKYAGGVRKTRNHRQRDGTLLKVEAKDPGILEHGCRYNIWQYCIGGGIGQRDRDAYKHPATFPELLARDHIVSWSNPDDLVVDPFAGSGTTCRMAKILGRRYIGLEINPEYAELANRLTDKILV